MRVATAVLAAVIALVLAGCGDDEEGTTEAQPEVTSPRLSEIRGSPEQQIEQTGEAWAPLFAADDVAACRYMFGQPLCERFWGEPGGESPEVGDPSGFQESFANATVERVEVKGDKAGAEFSNGEVVEFIQETDEPRSLVGHWFINDVGGNAGKKYFEPQVGGREEALEAAGLSEQAMSRENVELTRRAVDAFQRGDWDSALAGYHPEVEYEETPSLGPDAATYRGIEAVREAVQSWVGQWHDYSFEVRRYVDAGDLVVVLAHERGRGHASDVTVERELGVAYTFRNGKVVRAQLFGSWKEALEAAGLSE